MNNHFSAGNPEPESWKSGEVARRIDALLLDGGQPETDSESVEVVPVFKPWQKVEGLARRGNSPPALGMDEISRQTCRYLDFTGRARTAGSGSECRRHAPAPVANQLASWPQVTWEGSCREWESGFSAEAMVKIARAIADRLPEGPAGGFIKGASTKPVA